jgi:hypothetical protein
MLTLNCQFMHVIYIIFMKTKTFTRTNIDCAYCLHIIEANTINHLIIFILVAYNNYIFGHDNLRFDEKKDCPIQIGGYNCVTNNCKKITNNTCKYIIVPVRQSSN